MLAAWQVCAKYKNAIFFCKRIKEMLNTANYIATCKSHLFYSVYELANKIWWNI